MGKIYTNAYYTYTEKTRNSLFLGDIFRKKFSLRQKDTGKSIINQQ